MTLSTDLKTRVIIFFDRGHKFITQQQEDQLFQLSAGTTQKGIKIDGDYIAFSSIQRVVSRDEFYQQFPNKKPEFHPDNRQAEDYMKIAENRKPTKRHKEKMKKGFIDYKVREAGKTREQAESEWSDLINGKKQLVRSL